MEATRVIKTRAQDVTVRDTSGAIRVGPEELWWPARKGPLPTLAPTYLGSLVGIYAYRPWV